MTAPGGVWDSVDNGLYQLHIENSQVADNAGNFVQPGVIAGFAVNFPAECNDLEVVSYNLLAQRRIGRTVFDYDYSVTLKNNCMNPVGNFRFVPTLVPAVMTLLYDDITFDYIAPFDTVIGTGFFTVRMDSQAVNSVVDLNWEATQLILADISGDGTVGYEDLAILCEFWLTDNSVCDIAPPAPDGIINFLDFEAFAREWINN